MAISAMNDEVEVQRLEVQRLLARFEKQEDAWITAEDEDQKIREKTSLDAEERRLKAAQEDLSDLIGEKSSMSRQQASQGRSRIAGTFELLHMTMSYST